MQCGGEEKKNVEKQHELVLESKFLQFWELLKRMSFAKLHGQDKGPLHWMLDAQYMSFLL